MDYYRNLLTEERPEYKVSEYKVSEYKVEYKVSAHI